MSPPVFRLSVGMPPLLCLLISLAYPKPSSLSSLSQTPLHPDDSLFAALRILQLKRNANSWETCEECLSAESRHSCFCGLHRFQGKPRFVTIGRAITLPDEASRNLPSPLWHRKNTSHN